MVELEEIVGVYAAMVRRIATVYERDPGRVEDLTQDVWIAVWQALPSLRNQATLKGFVARITQNICVTHVRRSLVRMAQPLTDAFPDPAPDPDEAMAHAVRLNRLVEAVCARHSSSRPWIAAFTGRVWGDRLGRLPASPTAAATAAGR